MSVLIKGLKMPETEYMDVRIFRDGTATIATGTKPYYRELKAKPVRHGKWIFESIRGHAVMTCSECCKVQDGQTLCFTYCPNCGAYMGGEE